MRRLGALSGNTVGKKVAMATTGVLLFGFVVGHMVGNLKIFQGAEKYNHYAEFLREVGSPLVPNNSLLWAARIILIIAAVAHVVAAIQLTRLARSARPVAYKRPVHLETSYASRTMRWGGVIIAAFVVYHLLHFTWGTVHSDFVPGDVFHNVVAGFRVIPVSVVYILTMIALGFHLYHGIWSVFQTLGANHPRYNPARRAFAAVTAIAIVVGNISIPMAVMTGVVG